MNFNMIAAYGGSEETVSMTCRRAGALILAPINVLLMYFGNSSHGNKIHSCCICKNSSFMSCSDYRIDAIIFFKNTKNTKYLVLVSLFQ